MFFFAKVGQMVFFGILLMFLYWNAVGWGT
jgi:hypothetical protein